MFLTRLKWLQSLVIARTRKDRRRLATRNRKTVRLSLEQLESRLTPSAPTLSTLAFFNSVGPTGVVVDGSGNLYGAIGSGGVSNDGRIIELAKGSSTITTLASFNGTNGVVPRNLIVDSSGNLYGTTSIGGAYGYGTVFELAKGSSTITTLASFNFAPFNLTNGETPTTLVMDSSGNLYGTAGGGAYGYGTVFELAKGSSTITTLASFNAVVDDTTSLVVDSSGNLYGTTEGGGA